MTDASSTFSVQVFWLAIGLTAIPGVLGGITYGVSVFLKEIKAKKPEWPPNGHLSKSAFFWAQALSGLGGSLAALLVTLWANRFPDDFFEIKTWLSLVCTGYVAGYVANRLLPAIADSLYNRITKLAEKADAADDKAEEAKKASIAASAQAKQMNDLAIQLSTAMVRASDYLAKKDLWQVEKTQSQITTLEELAKSFSTNRTLIFLIVRLYEEAKGDRETPIKILNDFVLTKMQSGEGGDADTADAYWNLTYNYYYDADLKPRKDAAMRAKGVDAMRESLLRVPSYYEALLGDADFAEFCASEEAKAMLAAAKIKFEAWKKAKPSGETPKNVQVAAQAG